MSGETAPPHAAPDAGIVTVTADAIELDQAGDPDAAAALPVPAQPRHTAPRTLLERLMQQPQRFSFDAAVMVLMQASSQRDPGRAVEFHAPPGLAFPGADVLSVERPDGQFKATVTPIGLTGPSGVLPRPYTEQVVTEQRKRSPALAAFLDVLAQRPVALFAEAGIKYRPHRAAAAALLAGTPEGSDRSDPMADPFAAMLLALGGFGTPNLVPRLGVEPEPLLHFAGQFATRPRSADRLQAILTDWLGQPVEIEQFAGSWLALDVGERSALPVTLSNGGTVPSFNQLGVDASVGVRVWDVQSRIVLRVGPLDLPQFRAMLPTGRLLQRLVALVRAYLGFETAFAVNPVLARDAVPPLLLSGATPPQLGWNSWLGSAGVRAEHADEALFEAELVEMEQIERVPA
ncbi:type VI secretion system baseplate subunit TssG [Lichenicola cladoniae]|uniref:Type VI secretion system baseplate subunit TssG n=1 Tax=Lichenicola cladoniae TaxID=1484109 RepID=A0A6M8HQZ8_9PROT|nr:type VI secretion system baseplate subunit TssG [Lichenicola cladoniae]NPD68075.1 type VI secretion system baseplate subunit TssG [Acetobacteraceae bacterium]QKE90651.1 type VI secretion system baseplate subunit TssG [Lichenicola cladoniae]